MSQIQRVNDIKSTVEGKLMFNLILEALDILGLTFSKSVLLSEASLVSYIIYTYIYLILNSSKLFKNL